MQVVSLVNFGPDDESMAHHNSIIRVLYKAVNIASCSILVVLYSNETLPGLLSVHLLTSKRRDFRKKIDPIPLGPYRTLMSTFSFSDGVMACAAQRERGKTD